jgi:hypothetical protein
MRMANTNRAETDNIASCTYIATGKSAPSSHYTSLNARNTFYSAVSVLFILRRECNMFF